MFPYFSYWNVFVPAKVHCPYIKINIFVPVPLYFIQLWWTIATEPDNNVHKQTLGDIHRLLVIKVHYPIWLESRPDIKSGTLYGLVTVSYFYLDLFYRNIEHLLIITISFDAVYCGSVVIKSFARSNYNVFFRKRS